MTDMPNDQAVVAQRGPFPIDVHAGKKYFWCACGRSQNQPFCDGSHKDTSLQPVPYTADADRTLYFCGCKQTGTAPLCDGSHNRLS